MDWTQVFVIIGVLGTFSFWLFSKLDSDIKILGQRLDAQAQRHDSLAQRLDQLYQIYIDLLKEKK